MECASPAMTACVVSSDASIHTARKDIPELGGCPSTMLAAVETLGALRAVLEVACPMLRLAVAPFAKWRLPRPLDSASIAGDNLQDPFVGELQSALGTIRVIRRPRPPTL